MSQMIEFLTRVGADSSLRFGSGESLCAAMDAMGLDGEMRSCVSAGDAEGVRAQIVQQSAYFVALMPPFSAALMPAFSVALMAPISASLVAPFRAAPSDVS
ncbi:hypothetical protein [Luteibacter sp. dw_328]|uniref:hypothetical protein n=1 Tax=Luteibacter sp. dw_328 TaxID=2719796 RepID=UPI001BD56A57|nr:hypothetical protein [Luteibacter sp. dw_328]